MPRITLDLNNPEDLKMINAQWKFALGYSPGHENEGLIAQSPGSEARLPSYDDSHWDICTDIRRSHSTGFTFGWYRIALLIPEFVHGENVTGWRIFFETNADNYGEVWINGEIDRNVGTIVGLNLPQRIELTEAINANPTVNVACLVANGPLGEPRGGIFLRHATLAFENTDNY
ncbi:MAG: hypothetical protein ACJ0KI_09135 [Dehalococcoidia bacterium]